MKRKQWFAMLLIVVMVMSATPMSVFAADGTDTAAEEKTVTEQSGDIEGDETGTSSKEETVDVEEERAKTSVEDNIQEAEITEEEGTDAGYASSGTCGDNLTWTLDDNGTLTISGTGEMTNYNTTSSSGNTGYAPWTGNRSSINNVIIRDGVTSIGNNAFLYCSNLKSISIPVSLKNVNRMAFRGCSSLSDVYYSGTEEEWNGITILWKNGVDYYDENGYLVSATIHYESEDNNGSTSIKIDDYEAVCGEEFTIRVMIDTEEGFTDSVFDYSLDLEDEYWEETENSTIVILNSDGKQGGFDITLKVSKPGLFKFTATYNDETSATADLIIKPGKVQNLRGNSDLSTAAKAYTNYRRELDITWDSVAGDVKYEVEYSKNTDYTDAETADSDTVTYVGTDAPLDRRQLYYVRTRAYVETDSDTLYGEWSDTLQVQVGNQILVSEMWGVNNSAYKEEMSLDDFKSVFKSAVGESMYLAMYGEQYGVTDNRVMSIDTSKTIKLPAVCTGLVFSGIIYYDYDEPMQGTYNLTPSEIITSNCKSLQSTSYNLNWAEITKYTQMSMWATDFQDELYNKNMTGSVSSFTFNQGEDRRVYHLQNLYEAVKNCEEGEGTPVAIGLFNSQSGHCILAVGIKEESDDQVIVEVYDPNRMNDPGYLYLTKNANGEMTGWSFRNPGSEGSYYTGNARSEDSGITFFADSVSNKDTAADIVANTIENINQRGYANNTAWGYANCLVNEELEDSLENIVRQFERDDNTTGVMPIFSMYNTEDTAQKEYNSVEYWLNSDTLDLSDVPAGSQVTFAYGDHYVTANVSVTSDIHLEAHDSKTSVAKITPSATGTYEIGFYDAVSDSNQVERTQYEGTCEKGKTITFTQTSDTTVKITGAEEVTVTRVSREEKSGGSIANQITKTLTAELSTDSTYELRDEGRSAVIAADKNGDGIYEETIAEYESPYLFDPSFSGFASYDGGLFFVANGFVVTEANGPVQDPADPDNWYYCANGQVQLQYTGMAEYDGEWFYIGNGKLNTNLAAFVRYDTGLFVIAAGRLVREANGLIQDPNKPSDWYYCAAGQVQNQYTGLAQYDGAWFYVSKGKLDNTYVGNVTYDGATFHVDKGVITQTNS